MASEQIVLLLEYDSLLINDRALLILTLLSQTVVLGDSSRQLEMLCPNYLHMQQTFGNVWTRYVPNSCNWASGNYLSHYSR
jgi:hypothetical protein